MDIYPDRLLYPRIDPASNNFMAFDNDEQLPTCFLGCCNVRTWFWIVFIVNDFLLVLATITILELIISPVADFTRSIDVLFILAGLIILIVMNVRLTIGLIQGNIIPLLHWLQVYIVIYTYAISMLTLGVIGYLNWQDNISKNSKKTLEQILILGVLFGILLVPCYYPIYQYYKYEKKRSQQNEMV